MAAVDVSHLTELFGAYVAEIASENEPVAHSSGAASGDR